MISLDSYIERDISEKDAYYTGYAFAYVNLGILLVFQVVVFIAYLLYPVVTFDALLILCTTASLFCIIPLFSIFSEGYFSEYRQKVIGPILKYKANADSRRLSNGYLKNDCFVSEFCVSHNAPVCFNANIIDWRSYNNKGLKVFYVWKLSSNKFIISKYDSVADNWVFSKPFLALDSQELTEFMEKYGQEIKKYLSYSDCPLRKEIHTHERNVVKPSTDIVTYA